MAINSLSGFGGFYNNYKIPDIPRVDVSEIKEADINKQQEENSAVQAAQAPVVENISDTRSKVANLEDISLTFNKNDDFSLIGSESDLNSLDMEKAISDMKKDKIFEDYQFFVGSSDNVKQLLNNEDGKIIIK